MVGVCITFSLRDMGPIILLLLCIRLFGCFLFLEKKKKIATTMHNSSPDHQMSHSNEPMLVAANPEAFAHRGGRLKSCVLLAG